MKRLLVCASALFLFTVVCSAQERPRIAVVPFNYVGVSRNEAAALTALLETALVTTEAFQVIAQTDMGVVLEAQEKSLADCTDEVCALEIGKLLAAEQIVLGSVSALGATRIVTAGIIDVGTGQRIKGDKVESSSVEGLAKQMDLLAFMLAGLTYREGQEERVATEYGEVFVETVPDGAEVYLNGAQKAMSPYLLAKVPTGKVLLEARKGNLYARLDLQVTAAKLSRVSLKLEEVLGNLFISSKEKAVDVYLDRELRGPIGSGLLANVPVGTHFLELKGHNLYWSDDVVVTSDRTATVEATPRGVGALTYSLPEGVAAEVLGNDSRIVVRGEGTLELLVVGRYRVTTSSDIHEIYQTEVVIAKGQVYGFRPPLRFTAEHIEETARREREAAREGLSRRLDVLRKAWVGAGRQVSSGDLEEVETLVSDSDQFADIAEEADALLEELRARKAEQDRASAHSEYRSMHDALGAMLVGDARIQEADVRRAKDLLGAVRASTWDIADLETDLVLLVARLEQRKSRQDENDRIAALEDRRVELIRIIGVKSRARTTRQTVGISAAGIGLLGIGGTIASILLANQAYARYHSATITAEVEKARRDVQTWDAVTYTSGGATAGSAFLSGIMFLGQPAISAERAELAKVERALEDVGAKSR